MNNAVLGKTMENVRNHRDIKLVTTDKKRNHLVSEPNYPTTKYFSENLLAIEMKKTKVKMKKPVYLGISILDISKTLCMNFGMISLNQSMKTNYVTKLCYMDTDSFIIHIISENIWEDIANDVERWFDTSNYDENKTGKRLLPKGMDKSVSVKDEIGGKIMEEFCAIRAKTYAYLINGYNNDDYDKEKIKNKKAKGIKQCVIKHKTMFENYTDSLFNNKIILKSQRF